MAGEIGPTVEFKSDMTEALAALNRIGIEIRDLKNFFLEEIDPMMTEFFREQFATAGSAGGAPWPQNKPSTRNDKIFRGAQLEVMRDSDRLMDSYIDPENRDAIREIGPQRYARGSRVEYADIHQDWFTITKWGNVLFDQPIEVPPRQVVPERMPVEFTDQWSAALEKRIWRAWEATL